MKRDENMPVLFRTAGSISKLVKKNITTFNLTISEFSTLEVLYSNNGVSSVQAICDSILIANSSMSYVLDNLEERQLISREKFEKDKRVIKVTLTSEGSELIKNVMKRHYKKVSPLFSVLTLAEQDELKRLLRLIGNEADSIESKS